MKRVLSAQQQGNSTSVLLKEVFWTDCTSEDVYYYKSLDNRDFSCWHFRQQISQQIRQEALLAKVEAKAIFLGSCCNFRLHFRHLSTICNLIG